jgi:chemotaxis protein histidine kinase CheA
MQHDNPTPTTADPHAAALARFSPSEVELRDMAAMAALLLTVKDATIGQVHEARMGLKNTRLAINDTREALVEDAVRLQKVVNARAKELIGLIRPTEDNLGALQERLEEEKERKKREAEAKKLERALVWVERYRLVGHPLQVILARDSDDETLALGLVEATERHEAAERGRAAEAARKAEAEAAAKAEREAKEEAHRQAEEVKRAKYLLELEARIAAEKAARIEQERAAAEELAANRARMAELEAELAARARDRAAQVAATPVAPAGPDVFPAAPVADDAPTVDELVDEIHSAAALLREGLDDPCRDRLMLAAARVCDNLDAMISRIRVHGGAKAVTHA